ncbi:hypothetical protein [Bacillus sp. FJAT-29937]|uniref:hypothetical protein n=1 Tax=Bacillus sp. FJAT-29937 TaxID=1720553 RepID=UPI0012E3F22B|nr:hypothetical protein [Bacillus sp. FJAT-29937]
MSQIEVNKSRVIIMENKQISIFDVLEDDIKKEFGIAEHELLPWYLDPSHEWYHDYSICAVCDEKIWTRDRRFGQQNYKKVHIECMS